MRRLARRGLARRLSRGRLSAAAAAAPDSSPLMDAPGHSRKRSDGEADEHGRQAESKRSDDDAEEIADDRDLPPVPLDNERGNVFWRCDQTKGRAPPGRRCCVERHLHKTERQQGNKGRPARAALCQAVACCGSRDCRRRRSGQQQGARASLKPAEPWRLRSSVCARELVGGGDRRKPRHESVLTHEFEL